MFPCRLDWQGVLLLQHETQTNTGLVKTRGVQVAAHIKIQSHDETQESCKFSLIHGVVVLIRESTVVRGKQKR